MRKIINNKVYDTDTATRIGTGGNGITLCRKRTGEYFLHGCVIRLVDNTPGKEMIYPVSYHVAKRWAEEHLDVDTYCGTFGNIAEDARRVTITLSMRVDTVDALRRAAAAAGQSQSAYTELALLEAIKK